MRLWYKWYDLKMYYHIKYEIMVQINEIKIQINSKNLFLEATSIIYQSSISIKKKHFKQLSKILKIC